MSTMLPHLPFSVHLFGDLAFIHIFIYYPKDLVNIYIFGELSKEIRAQQCLAAESLEMLKREKRRVVMRALLK